MSEEIAYCKIFPTIGIARVGNSQERDGFFIGPEGIAPPGPSDERRFTDAAGAVLRQAARFRVYAFDAKDAVLGELTAEQADLTWSVSLANKKPEWFEFNGGAEALAQFEKPEKDSWDRRNASIKGAERKRRLIIDPGAPVTITGKDVRSSAASEYGFTGKFQAATDVYLGELRTDEKGRLLVLGGRGHSAAVDETGAEVSGKKWITNYANNDLWHDDTSDGPMECRVTLGGRDIPVKGRAWVLVTPPDFAPDIGNVVTLYDVMEDVALQPRPFSPWSAGSDRRRRRRILARYLSYSVPGVGHQLGQRSVAARSRQRQSRRLYRRKNPRVSERSPSRKGRSIARSHIQAHSQTARTCQQRRTGRAGERLLHAGAVRKRRRRDDRRPDDVVDGHGPAIQAA